MRPLVERCDARALRRMERRLAMLSALHPPERRCVDDVIRARHTPWVCAQDERPTPWSQNGSWLPWKAIAGCVMALRTDLGVTLNGSKVSAWADQSGNGHNASEGTASIQPSYTASNPGARGFPSIHFPYTGAVLLHPLGSVSSNFTVWCVLVGLANAASSFQCFYGNNAGVIYAENNGGPWGVYLSGAQSSGHVLDAGVHSLGCAVVSPTGAVTFATDGAITTGTGNGAYLGASSCIGAGTTSATGQGVNADLLELLVWNRTLTNAEFAELHAYAFNRYGGG